MESQVCSDIQSTQSCIVYDRWLKSPLIYEHWTLYRKFCISPHPLADLLWLRILELTTKFVVQGYPYHTTHSCAVIKPLQISISRGTRSIGSRFFRCFICKDVQNPFMLQDDLQLRYQLSKLGLVSLSPSNSEWRDSVLAIAEKK